MRSSRLPYVKTLSAFDFAFQPSIKREQIDALHELGLVERKENVVFLGPPGVGKTHLAISLAITAAESGRKIYFGTLTDLVNSLEEAKAAGRLDRRLKILTHPALLVVDEIGYLPVTQSGAVLFFQLVNRRYGNASTVLTSNKGFEEWGRILGDEVMAAALLDRLLPPVPYRQHPGQQLPHATARRALQGDPSAREPNRHRVAGIGRGSVMTTALPARCPAPIAPLPPRGSRRTGTLSMPITGTFYVPIEIRGYLPDRRG